MNSDAQAPRGLFDPHQPGLTSPSSMTDMEREELRRLAISMETEQDPEKVIAVAEAMNELLEHILSRSPRKPANGQH